MRTALSTINLVVGGIVVLGLALLALVGIIAVDDSPAAVPEALWTILGGVVGALASMLARTSSADPEAPPPPTVVYNNGAPTQPTPAIEPVDHA